MTCMKMPRSHSEAENVQFVQELAEVDGPFESPININFRDLTKLELPCLVWNRGDTCPKKMKITNTGHTVIISGKWKCERPYLCGGPLSGKYVFSQIHFHWGQDDCRGSEHLICGDGFPLEMHVAHFKTEYLTQENALREKDGMVVVVYLFKLQDEPNQNLKKIINFLPNIQQASTSYAIEPRPILSFCNPFTEDYFMYWGSVVTSTCAHILLWIICREPFGISRDQVNEFRKIMDSTQQPISRNSRDVQPLHCRNVFHVNASKHLDEPLLPVKKIMGCFCNESGENTDTQQHIYADLEMQAEHPEHNDHADDSHHHHHHHAQEVQQVQQVQQVQHECPCYQVPEENQEEVEGGVVEFQNGDHYLCAGGLEALNRTSGSPTDCYPKQTVFVQRATVSVTVKRFESEPLGNNRYHEKPLNLDETQINLAAKSCCFFPIRENCHEKPKRKTRPMRSPFNTIRAFSQIMHSLEVLKNQTFKKLKDIESINQEIKGMKTFCHDSEDRQWLRKLEKIMRRQKQFTINSSQGCLSELKKIAKDCTLGSVLQSRILSVGDSNGKTVWLSNDRRNQENLPEPKPDKIPIQEVISSKSLINQKSKEITSKTEELIQSFFEDIQENNEFHEGVKKDLKLKQINSICNKQAGYSNSVSSVIKGYITQNMFVLGNLGDRFFTEVTTDDFEMNDKRWQEAKPSELLVSSEIMDTRIIPESQVGKAHFEIIQDSDFKPKNDPLIPLHRTNVTVELSKTALKPSDSVETVVYNAVCFSDEEKTKPKIEILSDTGSGSRYNQRIKPKKKSENLHPRVVCAEEGDVYDSTDEKLFKEMNSKLDHSNFDRSASILSSEPNEALKLSTTKFRENSYYKTSLNPKTYLFGKKSVVSLHGAKSCKQFKGYYIQRKNPTYRTRKKQKHEKSRQKSSSSKEDLKMTIKKSKWKKVTKAKFKLEIERTSESSENSAYENSIISPKKKKQKLESQKRTPRTSKKYSQTHSRDAEIRLIIQPGTVTEKKSDPVDFGIQNGTENELPTVITSEESLPKQQQKETSDNATCDTLKTNLIDTNTNCTGMEETKESPETASTDQTKNKTSQTGMQTRTEVKLHKNLSLTNLSPPPRILKEISPKLYPESIDNKRKSSKELFDVREKLENTQKVEEKNELKIASRTLNEPSKSDDEKERREISLPEIKDTTANLAFNVGFFTMTSSQMDEELLPTGQITESKDKPSLLKRCDAEKYQFLEKGPQSQDLGEENPDLHQTDSNMSFAKDASKGDANVSLINKDLQSSDTYLNIKKKSTSRPHSDETLNSFTRNFKKKSKKRPHCCKRNSRHYIRKNSYTIKKPNKSESKTFNFLNLTGEEQLKIISLNVAKYLQQKLETENSDPDKTSTTNNTEEAVFAQLKASQEKIEALVKEPTSLKRKGLKQNETVKTKEKKPGRLENKTKTSPKSPSEKKIPRPATALPKPANNFIKLNKQMAGTYKKKRLPSPEKQIKPKEIENPCSEPTKNTETQKFKTRIPKKRVDKFSVQRARDETKINPETPSSSKAHQTSQKESRIKKPKIFRKTHSKEKDLATTTSTATTQEHSEAINEENPLSSAASQSIAVEKKHFVPAYTLTSSLPGPFDIVKNPNRKINKYLLGTSDPYLEGCMPEVLYDTKRKGSEGSETLFMKELEYFIQLQMYLNDEVPDNFEKPMSYVSSVLSLNQFGSSFKENPTVEDPPYVESCNKGIILLKRTNMNCSSSCSDFTEELEKLNTLGKAQKSKNEEQEEKQTSEMKIQQESEEPPGLAVSASRERSEASNSDSSYDCKISITLNTNFAQEFEKSLNENKEEGQLATLEVASYTPEGNSEHNLVISVSERNSQITFGKPHRRKRKETEISLEMKQKLLEILEAEIKREVEIKCGRASEHSSGGITFKWEDSDGNNKSQSPGSSCDNIEILAQISDTMRQYLQELKEKGQLVEIIGENSDKESKGDAS